MVVLKVLKDISISELVLRFYILGLKIGTRKLESKSNVT